MISDEQVDSFIAIEVGEDRFPAMVGVGHHSHHGLVEREFTPCRAANDDRFCSEMRHRVGYTINGMTAIENFRSAVAREVSNTKSDWDRTTLLPPFDLFTMVYGEYIGDALCI